MIGIIDYGAGNIRSLSNALDWLDCEVIVSGDPEELRHAEKLVLPGVGAFGDAMEQLRGRSLDSFLDAEVRDGGKPLLGICLGMQLLAKNSCEHGANQGLGYFDAEVTLFELPKQIKVPHIGWNDVSNPQKSFLYSGLNDSRLDFYFVHSYHMTCNNPEDVVSYCDYDGSFVAAIAKKNIVAAQFHPEKSQDNGIKFLENFVNWDI